MQKYFEVQIPLIVQKDALSPKKEKVREPQPERVVEIVEQKEKNVVSDVTAYTL